MRAFVVRPFGKREDIDFDAVGEKLIAPALAGTDYSGNTTEVISEAGSIHEDMFLELLGAQLVVADISIHNANVFYELGIRHALRPRATVLLRAKTVGDDVTPRAAVPFDIHGLRYCKYDPADPAAAVDDLKRSIRETAAAYRVDSPIYRLLPDLVVDAEKLRVLPLELTEQIDQARRSGNAADLRLLVEDVTGARFEEPALRRIAMALNDIGDRPGAIDAWVQLRIARPTDFEANHQLATLYARSFKLTESDQTIDRALSNTTLTSGQRSELSALRASNVKRRWLGVWCVGPDVAARQQLALRSPQLDEAINHYVRGFQHDLNNYYSGLNGLALASLQLSLIEAQPDVWKTNFASEEEAGEGLRAVQGRVKQLTTSVGAVLRAKADDARLGGYVDRWLLVSIADACFLLLDDRPRVIGAYERAIAALGDAQRPAVTDQLKLFADLGIREDTAEAAIATVGAHAAEAGPRERLEALVFTGHMIDRDGSDRFPSSLVERVADEIERRVEVIRDVARRAGRTLVGLAAGSDGGDILFHEACERAGVETRVYLPVPNELFRSSAGFSPGWLGRYLDVVDRRCVYTMNPSPLVPSWLDLRPETSTWPRFNRWILHHAKAATDRVNVLALWDGQPARGLGGVANMVDIAPRYGAAVDVIPIDLLRIPTQAEPMPAVPDHAPPSPVAD